MDDRKEILHEYNDVFLWLASIGLQDILLMDAIKNDAINATVKQFNLTYEYVNSLVAKRQFRYSIAEEPIVRFFHEYLRSIRDSHQ